MSSGQRWGEPGMDVAPHPPTSRSGRSRLANAVPASDPPAEERPSEEDFALLQARIDAYDDPPLRRVLAAARAEMADLEMVCRHLSVTYDYFTEGRVSKPNTLPDVVFRIADDLETERTEEAIREESARLRSRLEEAEGVPREIAEVMEEETGWWRWIPRAARSYFAAREKEGESR